MKNIVLIISMFISFITYSQQITLAGGNEGTGSGGSASFSVGQVVYTSNVGSTGSMAQGVQQPYEIYTLGTVTFPEISLKCIAYPNPTSDILKLFIENYEIKYLSYQLTDITGKIIQTNKIIQNQTIIDMSNRISATYFIVITENNKMLKTFKIIKN